MLDWTLWPERWPGGSGPGSLTSESRGGGLVKSQAPHSFQSLDKKAEKDYQTCPLLLTIINQKGATYLTEASGEGWGGWCGERDVFLGLGFLLWNMGWSFGSLRSLPFRPRVDGGQKGLVGERRGSSSPGPSHLLELSWAEKRCTWEPGRRLDGHFAHRGLLLTQRWSHIRALKRTIHSPGSQGVLTVKTRHVLMTNGKSVQTATQLPSTRRKHRVPAECSEEQALS